MSQIFAGTCPVCETTRGFESPDGWYRDHLLCRSCGSLPRERALAWALERFRPGWRDLAIHESSPADRGISQKLARDCKGYIGSQFFPDVARGEMRGAMRSEDLEALTFADESLDLHVHLDVMEHVNRPDLCFREMARTLRPGGAVIFTTPLFAARAATARRAVYFPDGVEHLAEPEYHGNPIDASGALVTFHYGQDLSDLIRAWVPAFSVCRIDLNAPEIGVLGEFRDVFLLTRGAL